MADLLATIIGGFPEGIEEYLEHGSSMKCIAFNRRWTLLAAGCNDGSCVIWDFETRGIAKELRDNECSSPITSICWSKCGKRILVSAADKSLLLWDVLDGKIIKRIVLEKNPMQACLYPNSNLPYLCLTCPLSCAPMSVDLDNGTTIFFKDFVSDQSNGQNTASRNKCSDGRTSSIHTAACLSKYGKLVYVGNSKGEILVIDNRDGEVCAMVPICGGSAVKNIVFNMNGQYLLTNSNDGIIRIYKNLLPPKDEVKALDELNENQGELNGVEKLKAVGSKCLTLLRELQDSITKVHWKALCFSGDGEWVAAGSASKGEHKVYIWDRVGHLVNTLEGPKEGLIDLAWHPIRPIVVSLCMNGKVYIWAKYYFQSLSAFAPDFIEIEQNEEYVEREDEFDLNPDTEKVKESDVNEDEEVDILTIDKDPVFSDIEEELIYLPVSPIPDVPEQPDHLIESSLNIVDYKNSGSPLSEPTGHLTNHTSSPVKDDAEGTNIKRMRKPSKKMLELQAESVKKASKSSKSLKLKDDAGGSQIKGKGKRSKKVLELQKPSKASNSSKPKKPMMPLSGPERKKYLAEQKEKKAAEGYVTSDPAGVLQQRVKRKDVSSKADTAVESAEVAVIQEERTEEGVAHELFGSPKTKKARTGKGGSSKRAPIEGEETIGGAPGTTSLNAQVSESFWHMDFDFHRYMEEKVPLAKVDVDAGIKAKFGDLVADAGTSALRILLMGHAMEKKHVALEAKYKDASEDVEKWKHKATSLENRLKEALKEKTVEKAATDAKEEREAMELEMDSWKKKATSLEGELAAAQAAVEDGKGELALYFDNGFERAKAQALHFNPNAKLDELDPFKVLIDGELVDEE